MKIEVGKYYRTREGRKARIYAVDGGGDGPIHGAIRNSVRGWEIEIWHPHGTYFSNNPCPKDLVSEWIDKPEVDWSAIPKWAQWVAMDEDGTWFWYADEKPEKYSAHWTGGYCSDSIPTAYAPKWQGDWKDSLIERPEIGREG